MISTLSLLACTLILYFNYQQQNEFYKQQLNTYEITRKIIITEKIKRVIKDKKKREGGWYSYFAGVIKK